jgi:hypothetical protein
VSKKNKVSIVSHDAGGAYLALNYLKYKNINFKAYVKGPALKIFRQTIEKSQFAKPNEIIKSDIIITTTGATNFEKQILIKSLKKGIYTISIIDHWVNYISRFTYKDKIYLPNEIWVVDIYALKMAKELFKNYKVIIKLKRNYYFKQLNIFNKKFNSKNKFNKNICLFSSPNISSNKLLLTKILKFIEKNFNSKNKMIIIRPHPKENLYNFNYLKKKFTNLVLSNNSIEKDLINSSIVFGSNSMGLVIANKIFKCQSYNLNFSNKFINLLPYKTIKEINLF